MTTFYNLAVPGVRQLNPYQPGKSIEELERELGIENIIKLASNENPLGPSPVAVTAIHNEIGSLSRYPDGTGYRLKQALCGKLGVDPDQLTLGNGSSDLLDIVARVFLAPGLEAVFSQHAFAMYSLVVQAVGGTPRVAPAMGAGTESPYGHDLAAMRQLVGDNSRLVFIANPNNPTGTYVNGGQLGEFLDSLPKYVVCVVDEAYFEYVEAVDYPDTLKWLDRYPNLIVTRTFSKAHGLAGLRAGYAVAHIEISNLLNRVRQPFNLNRLALVAAEAALEDDNHLIHSRHTNQAGLLQLMEAMNHLDLEVIPSVANFVCVDLKREATDVFCNLLREGVIVRTVANYELPDHIRVTIATEEENTIFIKALKRVLGK